MRRMPGNLGRKLAFLRASDEWVAESYGYGHLQKTRPLTLAYALSDSPAGLAGWIAEKFREWAAPSSTIPLDDLLTNITIYWITNTIGSSMRLYLESAKTPLTFARGERLLVPCGIAHFPFEAPFPPRSSMERVFRASGSGPRCRAADTLPRSKRPICWRRTSSPFEPRIDADSIGRR